MLHFAFVLAAAVVPWADLTPVLDAATSATTFSGAHVGILVVDPVTGARVYERNASDAFVPASCFKLLVGSVALAELGPDYRLTTSVSIDGTLRGQTLDGDLVLQGGGDAKLGEADLRAAAESVSLAGIRHITGSVVADDGRYDAPRIPGGWAVDDLPYDYAAPVTALSVDDNAVAIAIRPGRQAGDPVDVSIAAAAGAPRIENLARTGARDSDDTTALERPWNASAAVRIVGTYPAGAPKTELAASVPDPPSRAVALFMQQLSELGVTAARGTRTVHGSPPQERTIWSHASPPLSTILAQMWQPSDNLMAELLLNELGVGTGPSPDTQARGIDRERTWLSTIGTDPAALTIADGSGLSEYDRISPETIVTILQSDWNGPNRSVVLDALPEAGVRGTLAHVWKGTSLQGRVVAKTGTVSHARALAGYLQTKRHGTLLFAFLTDDWMGGAKPGGIEALRAAQQQFLQSLVEAP